MDTRKQNSLAPEFKNFRSRFSELDGTILDAPCGRGRHAISLQNLGCRVTCADIDGQALDELAYLNRISKRIDRKPFELCKIDLLNANWPFAGRQFSGALNVHFYNPSLTTKIASSLVAGGLFYLETVENRGGNFVQLPTAGEIRALLAGTFEFLYLKESQAGLAGSNKVTARMLARKI